MKQTGLSFLKPSSADNRSFNTKISRAIDTELRNLEARIAKEDPTITLDRRAIVETALMDAIEKTNRHLDERKRAAGDTSAR